MTPPESSESALVPDLEGRAITMEEYYEYAPEKLELIEGYLFLPRRYPELRLKLLRLLLANVGLLEAVKLAPEQRWREALDRTHGAA
jgi:hypothetical protein